MTPSKSTYPSEQSNVRNLNVGNNFDLSGLPFMLQIEQLHIDTFIEREGARKSNCTALQWQLPWWTLSTGFGSLAIFGS